MSRKIPKFFMILCDLEHFNFARFNVWHARPSFFLIICLRSSKFKTHNDFIDPFRVSFLVYLANFVIYDH